MLVSFSLVLGFPRGLFSFDVYILRDTTDINQGEMVEMGDCYSFVIIAFLVGAGKTYLLGIKKSPAESNLRGKSEKAESCLVATIHSSCERPVVSYAYGEDFRVNAAWKNFACSIDRGAPSYRIILCAITAINLAGSGCGYLRWVFVELWVCHLFSLLVVNFFGLEAVGAEVIN